MVLAAAVCSKQGKALISRQFVEMTRIRIEGLLAAFPKLMGSGNKQHTFVETETVRYVYQPIENLFLLILTTKSSNIVEDLETLRLLSKVVPDVCDGYTEERISMHCFELIFAFDEVRALFLPCLFPLRAVLLLLALVMSSPASRPCLPCLDSNLYLPP